MVVFCSATLNQVECFLFRPLLRGARNYTLNWVFFVQSILADRHIHRRELRLVSLESLSSVEYGIKKIIFGFSILTRRYRGLNFRENRVNSVDIIHLFSEFLTKVSQILIKFNKIFRENVVDFTFNHQNTLSAIFI